MIIVGYQGIGKSTISSADNGFIDLESSNFFVNGKRSDDWYIPYCNIARELSGQGYDVFVSSHFVVRQELKNYIYTKKVIVCPSVNLKEFWIKRLQKRYYGTKTDKDFKALMNATERYEENIRELLNEDGFDKILIESVPYQLDTILLRYKRESEGEQ